eukprot:908016-Pelagomonas_calceolata.AAC.3
MDMEDDERLVARLHFLGALYAMFNTWRSDENQPLLRLLRALQAMRELAHKLFGGHIGKGWD